MVLHAAAARLRLAGLLAFTTAGAVLLIAGDTADAAIVPTVPLGTSANFSVLGAETVTNTGPTTLALGVGVAPGTAITGFGAGGGTVAGETHAGDAVALQAQADLNAAYVNAAGRVLTAETPAELSGLILQGGVYAATGKGPLTLNGALTLDGAGDPNSVFIFQTNSSLITGATSTVNLINGAQECNVFWQVGSSATLGDASVSFTGNILANITVTVAKGVVVHGRALADTGAVTLNNDTFLAPTCDLTSGATTTTTATGDGTTTTAVGGGDGGTTATTAGGAATTSGGGGSGTGLTGGGSGSGGGGGTATTLARSGAPGTGTGDPGVPGVVGPPRTGGAPLRGERSPSPGLLFAVLFGGATTAGLVLRHRTHPRGAPSAER